MRGTKRGRGQAPEVAWPRCSASAASASRASRPTSSSAASIPAATWSLNGQHLPDIELAQDHDLLVASGTTVESGVDVVVASTSTVTTDGRVLDRSSTCTHPLAVQRTRIELAAGQSITVDTIGVVVSSSDVDDPGTTARSLAGDAAAAGYEHLREASRARWHRIWEAMDVEIHGDVID